MRSRFTDCRTGVVKSVGRPTIESLSKTMSATMIMTASIMPLKAMPLHCDQIFHVVNR